MRPDNLASYSEETIHQNALVYKFKISTKSKLIYSTTLLCLLTGIVSLPFVFIKISVKSEGVIQSVNERTELFAPVGGRLLEVKMEDNATVKTGQTLLVIDAALANRESILITEKTKSLQAFICDLKKIIFCIKKDSKADSLIKLTTGQYSAGWQQYQQEINKAQIDKNQAETVYKRYEILFRKNVITIAEFEKYKFDFDQAQASLKLIKKKYAAQWQADLTQYYNDLRQVSGEMNSVSENQKQYIIKAPINGSLQNLGGLKPGGFVFANQKIAEISPNDKLIAFCYIKPKDIGLIHKGQKAQFQVDAFNYNQWGVISGHVTDISDDIMISSNTNQPFFKVKCVLDKNFLKLKNGYQGNIKKGMGIVAHFTVTERSIYELLYDKVDDWINPNLRANN